MGTLVGDLHWSCCALGIVENTVVVHVRLRGVLVLYHYTTTKLVHGGHCGGNGGVNARVFGDGSYIMLYIPYRPLQVSSRGTRI